MNLLIVVAEILLAAGVGKYMQAMSVEIGKATRKPTIGYALLLLLAVPFIPKLPAVLDNGYFLAVLTQIGFVLSAVLIAALVPITGLLIASNIADSRR